MEFYPVGTLPFNVRVTCQYNIPRTRGYMVLKHSSQQARGSEQFFSPGGIPNNTPTDPKKNQQNPTSPQFKKPEE